MPSSVISVHTLHDVKEDPEKATAELEFPEGGTAAWCAVIGAASVQFCCFGYTTSFGVYQDFYTRHYLTDESSSAISWIGGTNVFVVTLVSVGAGMLYDRGYFYYLLIGGSLLQSFTLFMLSLAQPGQYYQIFLSQGVGLGIAQGLMYIPNMAVVSHYFSRRRTLAMSLVASGSSLGSIIHPLMLNNLFSRLGFANGVRISAGFVSVLLLTSCLIVRPRSGMPKRSTKYLSVARSIIHDVPYCLMVVGLLIFQLGFYFPLFYIQLDSILHGNSEIFSFNSLVLLNGGNLIGRLSNGFIAPYVGVPNLMIISTALCGVFILGMIGLGSVPSFVVLGTFFGYFCGTYIASFSPLVAYLSSDLSEFGARMGIAVMVTGIGGLVAGPISGALLTSHYKWWQAALFAGLMALLGCSLLVMMQFVLKRRACSAEKQKHDASVSENNSIVTRN